MSKPAVKDEWTETWDWAREIWGATTEIDKQQVLIFMGNSPMASRMADEKAAELTFSWFFRSIASKIAESEGWEELGSSDVWHASYDCVKRAKADGKVKTRAELQKYVRDWHGHYYY